MELNSSQQKILLVTKFTNTEFLENLSNRLESLWRTYKVGCNLSHINTDEDSFDSSYLTEYVKQQLQFAQMYLINLRQKISWKLASKMTNTRQ